MWPHQIWQFGGAKSYLVIWGVNLPWWFFFGGVNHTDDLSLKSPSMIRFTPPEITREDLPLISPRMIYPPPKSSILSKISDTQHHALLHKGLFCERPKTRRWWPFCCVMRHNADICISRFCNVLRRLHKLRQPLWIIGQQTTGPYFFS